MHEIFIMERILVTTDFSSKSRAGMRFAIQLAQKAKIELVFLHIHQVLRASFWSDQVYEYYIQKDKENCMRELNSFVREVYRGMKVTFDKCILDVHHNLEITKGIIEYAEQHTCTYICISTRGAGVLKKIIGTHTGSLITNSPIPVLCIPATYRVKPIDYIVYASDMVQYQEELASVIRFAKMAKARLEILHFYYEHEVIDIALMKKQLKERFHYNIKVNYIKRNTINPVLHDIKNAIGQLKPSLIVMFTNPRVSFIEEFFIPGNAKRLSYQTSLPLLSFSKRTRLRRQ